MKKKPILLMGLMSFLAGSFSLHAQTTVSQDDLGTFMANHGQVIDSEKNLRPDILFYGQMNGTMMYFGKDFISHVWRQKVEGQDQASKKYRMDLELVNANTSSTIAGEESAQGYTNYFLAHIPEGVTNVPTMDKLVYNNVWPGIDMEVKKGSGGERIELRIKPDANADNIKFRVNGAENMDITGQGNLLLLNELGSIEYERPRGVIKEPNKEVPINNVRFVREGNLISITLPNAARRRDVIIRFGRRSDGELPYLPAQTLEWSTYYGGSENIYEDSHGMHIDNAGNIYVTGTTSSPDFPTSTGSFQEEFDNEIDAYVIKFNPNRGRAWATFFGGEGYDYGFGVSTDASGSVFFVGPTSSRFLPMINPGGGAYFSPDNGTIYIAKLSANGQNLLWATYFSGAGGGNAEGIKIKNDKVYIYGYARTGFPFKSLAGAYNQQTFEGGLTDGFLARFSTNGNLEWSTYLGGPGEERITGCDIDDNGEIYFSGFTSSQGALGCSPNGNFPVCRTSPSQYTSTNNGGRDAFLVKFSPEGQLLWSTMYGGSADDYAYDGIYYTAKFHNRVSILRRGNHREILLTGATMSDNFPIIVRQGLAPFNQTTYGGNMDVFMSIFSMSGEPIWSSYFGGSGIEACSGVAVDNDGSFYITGITTSTNLPIKHTGNFYNKRNMDGYSDAFIGKFNEYHQLWTTYFGGNNLDAGKEIVYDFTKQTIIISGTTTSNEKLPLFNKSGSYFDGTYNGGTDLFFTEIKTCEGAGCIYTYKTDETSGVEEAGNDKNFIIYPNPAHDKVFLQLNGIFEKTSVTIYNLMGAKVLEHYLNPVQENIVLSLDLNQLAVGIYQVRIENSQGIHTGKFIKQ
jgi:hypothetical protein